MKKFLNGISKKITGSKKKKRVKPEEEKSEFNH